MISLSDMWMSRKEEFTQILSETVRENGEVTAWVEFFCDSYASECESLKVKVKRLGGGNIPKTKWGKQVALTERQIMLMESFQTRSEMTMTETRNVLPMVSEDTILRDLAGLIDKKLIKKKGKTKGAKYILTRAIL
jgi:predicted HTH transcriptional regulator